MPKAVLQALRIEDAGPSDAQAILELKRLGFGDTYLEFTPFQAPASVRALEGFIREAGDHVVRLARLDGIPIGYTMGNVIDERIHLSYIASSPDQRGHGFGRMLLRDFQQVGRSRGCKTCTLDVFESNPALGWYLSSGYRQTTRSCSAIVNLTAATGEIRPNSESGYRDAIEMERQMGSSRFEASLDGCALRLGLIAGHTVRVIQSCGLRLDRIAPACAGFFGPGRSKLLVHGMPEVPANVSLHRLEWAVGLELSL